MINNVKNELKKYINKKIILNVDIGRNKYETYKGYIIKCYERVWIFYSNNSIKCFTYQDLITNTVNIKIV